MKAKFIFYIAMLQIFLLNLWLKIAPKIGDAFLWLTDFIFDNWRAILALVIGYLLGG